MECRLRILLACLLAVAGSAGLAGESASLRAAVSRPVAPRAAPLAMADAVRDKNFPFFRTLESQRTRLWLQREPAFAALTLKYRQRLQTAQDACAAVAACYVEAVRWSAADIGKVGDALRTLCSKAVAGCRQIARELREGGTMIRQQGRSDADLLAEAWALQMGAVMRTLAIYGDGGAPRYRDIDAMAGDPKSAQFAMQLREVAQAILATKPADRLFMADALQFSLRLLAIDGRDEAGRLEPMERGENRAAYRQVARVQWSRFPYSAILVPGSGPDSLEVRLSPKARQRLTAAVTRYRAQAAPFIIVSGGYVHPARTPYCEALEMKRALVEEYAIPASAIIIDPHARHTTTNVRNAARLMFRYGMPMSKPGLIVTDEQQAASIAAPAFDERNQRETGTIPYRDKQLLSPVEVTFVPSVDALQVGFEDPLDP